jgi:very-short-patch-repair endonuclease
MIPIKEKQKLCFIRRKRLIENATPSELIFKKRLDDLGIKYIFQKGFIAGKNFCIVDFYLPKPYKLAIEIDGDSHNLPGQIKRDSNKEWYLSSRKIKTIHVKNFDVKYVDILSLIKK